MFVSFSSVRAKAEEAIVQHKKATALRPAKYFFITFLSYALV
jgi:hypothetical protein